MDFERYNKEVPQKQPERIPYIAFESELARNERTIRRLIISLVLSVVLIFASNAVWLLVWCQYDYSGEETTTTTTVDQDGKGTNVYGDSNEINGAENNGNSKAEKKTQKKEERR